jgi:hypothetical protein
VIDVLSEEGIVVEYELLVNAIEVGVDASPLWVI